MKVINYGDDYETLIGSHFNYAIRRSGSSYLHLPELSIPLKARKYVSEKFFIEGGVTVSSAIYYDTYNPKYFSFGLSVGAGYNLVINDRKYSINPQVAAAFPMKLGIDNERYSNFKLRISLTRKFELPKKKSSEYDYWDNNEALLMDNLDSADKYLQDIKLTGSSNIGIEINDTIPKRDSTQVKKDSLKTVLNKRFGKNTIKLEFAGMSGIIGLVYERNLYRNDFDVNLRGGITFLRFDVYCWNFGVIVGTNKYYVNPFFAMSITQEPTYNFIENPIGMLSLGITFKFNKRWDVQMYQSLAVGFEEFSTDPTFFWGGINLGYSF
jgi:hypothetical protein